MMSTEALKVILVSLDLIAASPDRIIAQDKDLGVAVATMQGIDEERGLSLLAHLKGRCAGFEVIDPAEYPLLPLKELHTKESLSPLAGSLIESLRKVQSASEFDKSNLYANIPHRENIEQALSLVSPTQIESSIRWFSSYPTRYHRSPNANQPVRDLMERSRAIVASRSDAQLDLISHRSTAQNSLRVRLPGTSNNAQVVILGGHLDSINSRWGQTAAPGADDNASGVSSLLEAMRVLVQLDPLPVTVEFMFYGGEESGLLGSAEIARSYAQQSVPVLAKMQLDMTSFPGSGKNVFASMNDFTDAGLRNLIERLNQHYIGATLINDRCGYGCSDHASWHRQGFPAVMPTEARFSQMNRRIHTAEDLIDSSTSFEHSAMFSRLAVAMAMELGHSVALD